MPLWVVASLPMRLIFNNFIQIGAPPAVADNGRQRFELLESLIISFFQSGRWS